MLRLIRIQNSIIIITYVDLNNTKINGAYLTSANRSPYDNLSSVNLTSANLTGANLYAANLNGAYLTSKC